MTPTPERLRELAEYLASKADRYGNDQYFDAAAILRSRADEIEAEARPKTASQVAIEERAISDMNSTVRNLQRIADALEKPFEAGPRTLRALVAAVYYTTSGGLSADGCVKSADALLAALEGK